MSTLEIVCGILLILSSLFLIVVVAVQEPKTQGMGAISGGSDDSFFSHNKSRTKEAKLNRLTKGSAIVMFVVTLLLNGLIIWMK